MSEIRPLIIGMIAAVMAVALLAAALARKLDQAAGFFGAGTMLLIAALCFESTWLNSRSSAPVGGQITLGLRSATYRPGRSIMCIALIASATSLIVPLDDFRI